MELAGARCTHPARPSSGRKTIAQAAFEGCRLAFCLGRARENVVDWRLPAFARRFPGSNDLGIGSSRTPLFRRVNVGPTAATASWPRPYRASPLSPTRRQQNRILKSRECRQGNDAPARGHLPYRSTAFPFALRKPRQNATRRSRRCHSANAQELRSSSGKLLASIPVAAVLEQKRNMPRRDDLG